MLEIRMRSTLRRYSRDSPEQVRRTKIVATVGPATSTAETLHELLGAGVDVVRLNAAHASVEVHAERAVLVRDTADALGRAVGILVYLPGPKMRSGPVAG